MRLFLMLALSIAAVAMSFVAALAFSDFGPARQDLPRVSFGENAREWIAIRPQGGSNRGPLLGGANAHRCKGLLGLALV